VGGTEVAIYEIAKRLMKKKNKVVILTQKLQNSPQQEVVDV